MRHLLYIFITSSVLTAFKGCSSEPEVSAEDNDSIEIPNMVTTDVNMLISDSGVIKYKAISPLWYVYENDVKNKYWYFPEGIRLDQVDHDFETEFSIESDTAYNYETKQLWHLIKNVKVHSTAGEYFETNDLYWDMRNHKVYSDSFIHIERPDAIIEGFGFTSDDAFTKYEIRQSSGIFPFREDSPMSAKHDSIDTFQEAGAIAEQQQEKEQEEVKIEAKKKKERRLGAPKPILQDD